MQKHNCEPMQSGGGADVRSNAVLSHATACGRLIPWTHATDWWEQITSFTNSSSSSVCKDRNREVTSTTTNLPLLLFTSQEQQDVHTDGFKLT